MVLPKLSLYDVSRVRNKSVKKFVTPSAVKCPSRFEPPDVKTGVVILCCTIRADARGCEGFSVS